MRILLRFPSLPLVRLIAAGLALLANTGLAAEPGAEQVFARYQHQVVQIRVLEASSGSQTSIGSGFVVSDDGQVITNYHVVAALIHKPGRYRAEIVHSDDVRSPLTLLDFDAIHDLALVRSERRQPAYFRFRSEPIAKGTRIFAIGNPRDLGMTIVEGTHSGLLARKLYDEIHFTGSLNAGMSGGPAVASDGAVVGVNVATSGNQVSFLVPAAFAQRLLAAQSEAASEEPDPSWLSRLRNQMLAHQDVYFERIFARDWATTALGPYRVPSEIAPFIKCWGDSPQRKKLLYETTTQSCSFEDSIYLSRDLRSGTLRFAHTFFSSDQLNRFRFYGLYQKRFADVHSPARYGNEEHVGPFRCEEQFIDQPTLTFKVVFCARGYRKLPGLYDSIFKIATLDRNHVGLQSTLTMTGVSFTNARAFGERFLQSIVAAP